MNRRHFLALASTTALAGCSLAEAIPVVGPVISTVLVSAQALKDLAALAAGLLAAAGVLTGNSGFTTASNDIQLIVQDVDSITAATTQPTAANIVTAIVTTFNDVLAIGAQLPLPFPFNLAVEAASTLLPTIEKEVGLVASGMMAVHTTMTVDQARQTLLQLATPQARG